MKITVIEKEIDLLWEKMNTAGLTKRERSHLVRDIRALTRKMEEEMNSAYSTQKVVCEFGLRECKTITGR